MEHWHNGRGSLSLAVLNRLYRQQKHDGRSWIVLNLTVDAAARGRILGVETRVKKANEFAEKVTPIIMSHVAEGLSLNQITWELNKVNFLMVRGKAGSWTPTAVSNVMNWKTS